MAAKKIVKALKVPRYDPAGITNPALQKHYAHHTGHGTARTTTHRRRGTPTHPSSTPSHHTHPRGPLHSLFIPLAHVYPSSPHSPAAMLRCSSETSCSPTLRGWRSALACSRRSTRWRSAEEQRVARGRWKEGQEKEGELEEEEVGGGEEEQRTVRAAASV